LLIGGFADVVDVVFVIILLVAVRVFCLVGPLLTQFRIVFIILCSFVSFLVGSFIYFVDILLFLFHSDGEMAVQPYSTDSFTR
jgi:hypothetical protein